MVTGLDVSKLCTSQKMRWISGKTIQGRKMDVLCGWGRKGWAKNGQSGHPHGYPVGGGSVLSNALKEELWGQEKIPTRKCKQTRFKGDELVPP